MAKLSTCANELEQWGCRVRMRFRNVINDCKRTLEDFRGINNEHDVQAFTSTKERLNILL